MPLGYKDERCQTDNCNRVVPVGMDTCPVCALRVITK